MAKKSVVELYDFDALLTLFKAFFPDPDALSEEEIVKQLKTIPKGVFKLAEGYLSYAKDVVEDRALVAIDGLKPSQRRILWTMYAIEKVKDLTKSANIAGATMKLHPHGDATIYKTMVRMVNSSETLNVPMLHGKGNFGKVYSADKHAEARYTECRLTEIAQEYFGQMAGVIMKNSYDNARLEPEILPVSFPAVLCNFSKGIAVGVATDIPAYNFVEVNNATIELIETGNIVNPLIPDFTTKGFVVNNPTELKKLHEKGRGTLAFRGKWAFEGKSIVITEVPYFTTVAEIENECKNLPGVTDTRDESDRKGLRLVIEVQSISVLEEVLQKVLRHSKLQMKYSFNMFLLINGKPICLGVKDILKEWVTFREGVLKKEYAKDLLIVEDRINSLNIMVDILKDKTFAGLIQDALRDDDDDAKASELLRNKYPTITDAIINWILDMKLRTFYKLNLREQQLNAALADKNTIETNIANIRKVIVKQLKDLNKLYGKTHTRRTVATNHEYTFEPATAESKREKAVETIVVIQDKFIKKIKAVKGTEDIEGIQCMSDDTISFIDNQGRLLRVALEKIDFVKETDKGIYLTQYLGIDDDYTIMMSELVENKKVSYLYSDGYVSVVDYSEWVNPQRKTKLTQKGVAAESELIITRIGAEYTHVMLVTEAGRIGFASTDILEKSRTARTKFVTVAKGDKIVSCKPLNEDEIPAIMTNAESYIGKVKFPASKDIIHQAAYTEVQQR